MARKPHAFQPRYILALIFLLATLVAQNPTSDIDAKIEQAKDLADNKQYNQAIALFQETLPLSKGTNLAQWLDAQRGIAKLIGDSLRLLTPKDSSKLMLKGLQYIDREVIPQIWASPSNSKEYRQYCLLLIRKAEYEKRIRNFDAAKDDLLLAMSYLEQNSGSDQVSLAEHIYRELGNSYVVLGDYEGAEQIFKRSVVYAETSKAPEVVPYNDFGSVYLTLQNFPEALRLFEQGILIGAGDDADQILLHLNKAECLALQKRFKEALNENKIAADRIKSLAPSDDRYERCTYGLYENYGIIYTGMAVSGDKAMYDTAEKWYVDALEMAKKAAPAPTRDIAGFECGIAEVLKIQARYEDALRVYHAATRVLAPCISEDVSQQPPIDSLYAEKIMIRALEGKAECFLALKQPEKALECYERIPVVATKLIATHSYESSSLRTQEEGRVRSDKAVTIAWELFEKTGQRSFAERAFALTEQARAIIMIQSMARAKKEFQLPPAIRKEEKELDALIAWDEQRLASEKKTHIPDDTRLKELNEEIFDLKKRQQLLKEKLRREYPDYTSLSEALQFAGVKDIPKLLYHNQALLDYYLTDSVAYVFFIHQNGDFRTHKAILPPLFRDLVFQYFKFLSIENDNIQDKTRFLEQSYKLYEWLIQPVLANNTEETKSLLIVPDDALSFIPFDVLMDQPGNPDSAWRSYNYLLNTYAVGYAYSATLLDMQQKISADHRSKPAPKFRFAGFAPSYGSAPAGSTRSVQIPDSLIYDIKSTQEELTKVHTLMGGQAFPREQSSEQTFKNIAPDCGILLLAMHGLANDEYPELSCLLFGRPKGDSVNNDVLFANELQVMRLQADLAVLSACHTGFGKLHKGEGIYSLARAFAIAGVPSTVMSMWRLHESTAPELTEAFFKYLKDGKCKDEALRLAKLDFLKNDKNYDNTLPFYWAGVTVSGDMCPLESPYKKWYWMLAILLALFGGWYFWKKRGGMSYEL